MNIPVYQVDAFTDRPFAGNPAAVCIVPDGVSEAWMQSVAAEMNLAETAFLTPSADGYGLRWFTPQVEVDLCGHATLAAAHVLWDTDRLPHSAVARFHTRSGLLAAERLGALIELDFPAEPAEPVTAPPGLAEALGVQPAFVGRNRLDYLVEVADGAILRRLQPDFRAITALSARGIIVTCVSDVPEHDFLSRFFAPACGIDEDPVTGSAHCCLGPYWAARLNRTALSGYQVSARGGIVGVRMEGSRVKLIGSAVTVLVGRLCVDP